MPGKTSLRCVAREWKYCNMRTLLVARVHDATHAALIYL